MKKDNIEEVKDEIKPEEKDIKVGKFGDTFCFLGIVVSIVGLILAVLEAIFHATEVVGPVLDFVVNASQICIKVGLVSLLIYLLFIKENK